MAEDTKPNNKATGQSTCNLKDFLAPIVAILALLAFTYFAIYMMNQRSAEELQWTRAVYIFAGVESIAFAAAGFFFGSEVRRQQAENAQESADEAQEEADAAKVRATEAETKGKALKAAISAKIGGQNKRASQYATLGAKQAVTVSQVDFQELDELASQLFP